MISSSPITPPPELVQQWLCSDDYLWGPFMEKSITITTNRLQNVATQAAQYGADQELEGCCEWLRSQHHSDTWPSRIRAARRPKPSSLKEQALTELEEIMHELHDTTGSAFTADAIRRALESLDD